MKKSSCHWLKVFAGIVLLCSLVLSGCVGQAKTDQQKPDALQQKPADLLEGEVNAVCYSEYRHEQHPDLGAGAKSPTDEEILEDFRILTRNSNFRLIRLYNSGPGSGNILKLIRANKLDIKVILGIWLTAEVSNHEGCAWLTEPIPQEVLDKNKIWNEKEIERAIKLANEYQDIVVAVSVGNEIRVNWSDHVVGLESLISHVRRVKKSITQQVTVADDFAAWVADGPTLAKEVDFIMIHSYPLWHGRDINEGLSFFTGSIQSVRKVIPKGRFVIGETGWATIGSELGDRAGEEKQIRYYKEITKWAAQMNITTFFFEAFDEDWKGEPNNPLGAEKHWGLFTIDRKPKPVMYEKYPDLKPTR